MSKQALKLAMSVVNSGALEKMDALLKIRELVIADEGLQGTSARNSHPAFKAVLESLHEITEPNLHSDMEANEKGKYAGVMNASNLVGILASLGGLLDELKSGGKSEKEIVSNPDVKCIISQARNLTGA